MGLNIRGRLRAAGPRLTPLLVLPCLLLATLFPAGCEQGPVRGQDAWTPGSQLTPEQKMEDFRYMFEVIRDNYPFHWVKARTDGFGWIANEKEFESWVSATRDDTEFAQVMRKLVTLLNNSHTHICHPGELSGFERLGGPWREEARKTSPERVDYWWRMCGSPSYGTPFRSSAVTEEPFVARYSGGSYIVVDVWPGNGPESGSGNRGRSSGLPDTVVPGCVVVSVDGRAVNEYVSSLYGTLVLKYDPLRKILYLPVLTLNPDAGLYRGDGEPTSEEETGEIKVTFRNPSGETFEVEMPRKVPAWSSSYRWPPVFSGEYRTDNIYCTVVGDSVAYVQVRPMKSEYRQDMAVLSRFMDEACSLPFLVIDIRGNGGGNDMYWREMVRQGDRRCQRRTRCCLAVG